MLLSIVVLARHMSLKYVDPNDLSRLRDANGHRLPANFDEHTVIAQLSKAVFNNFPPGFYFVVAMIRDHPGARGEHRVHRLPGARLDPARGMVSCRASSARAATGSPTATGS